MDNILEIVLQARDEATKVIEGVGNAVDKAGKQAEAMSTAFKVAGGILTGVGLAGLATLKSWADAASADEATWASVNQTLQNVSERMQTTTVAVAGNAAELKASKVAIDAHIASLKQQILTYRSKVAIIKTRSPPYKTRLRPSNFSKCKSTPRP